jgi:hypothetical protein
MPKLTEDVAKWAHTQRHWYGNGNFGNFETNFWGPWNWKGTHARRRRTHEQHGTESRRVVGLIRDRGTGKIVHQDAGLQRTPPAWQCNHCLKSVGELGRRLFKHLVLPLTRSPSLWLSYSLSLHNPRDRWFLKQMSPPG